MKKYVAYLRVSTTDQEDSQLGLEGQRRDIQYYLDKNGGEMIEWLTEIESGTAKKSNQRPILDMALQLCKEQDATLLIAKIDRLYRSVYFISKLMMDKTKFIALDNPHATDLTIYIMAAFAEDEAKRISERTKKGLGSIKEQIKRNGSYVSRNGNTITHLGTPQNFSNEGRMKGGEAFKQKALNNPKRKQAKLIIANMMDDFGLSAIATAMNESGMTSPSGKSWHATTVKRLKVEILKEKEAEQ